MIGAMFWMAVFTVILVKFIKYLRRQGPDGRRGGWWGGRGKDPQPKPSRPKPSGPDRDPELLYFPDHWDDALAKWAKKVVKDSKNAIKVGRSEEAQ